jgi:hypothetical protein
MHHTTNPDGLGEPPEPQVDIVDSRHTNRGNGPPVLVRLMQYGGSFAATKVILVADARYNYPRQIIHDIDIYCVDIYGLPEDKRRICDADLPSCAMPISRQTPFQTFLTVGCANGEGCPACSWMCAMAPIRRPIDAALSVLAAGGK